MLYLTLDADFTIHKQLVEATAAGAAAQIDTLTNDGKAKQAIMVCVATASGSTIELETSDDGTTWTSLGSWSSAAANDVGVVTGVDLKRYVRANATTVVATSRVDAQIILTGYKNKK